MNQMWQPIPGYPDYEGNGSVIRRSLASRFWSKVNKTDGCWLWTASLMQRRDSRNRDNKHRYGRFTLRNRPITAHRMAWILTHGEIPNGLWVLHRCDVPQCVRPDHLFLGTVADNVADMCAKGRQNLEPAHAAARAKNGEKNSLAKLTWEQVREIRRLHSEGYGNGEIGRRFGVSHSHVWQIVKHKAWLRDPLEEAKKAEADAVAV